MFRGKALVLAVMASLPLLGLADLSDGLVGTYSFGPEMSGRTGCVVNTNAFTASLWICPRQRPRWYPTAGLVFMVGNGYYHGFRMSLRSVDGGYSPTLEVGQPEKSVRLNAADRPYVREGRWTHLVGQWDGRKMRILLDGEEIVSRDCAVPYVKAPNDLLTVGLADGGLLHFAFDFEKFSIWRRPLADDDLATLLADRPTREPPLRLVAPPRDFAAERATLAKIDPALFPHRGTDGWKPLPFAVPPRPVPSEPSVRIFVSPSGDDNGDGTREHPFATLKRVRDAVRALPRPLPVGGVAVCLREGLYKVTETLELTSADSGERGREIVWRSCDGERAVLSGAWPVRGWKPLGMTDDPRIAAKARGKLFVADVKAAGFTALMPLNKFGWAINRTAEATDLYWRGKACTLAREPDEGWFETKAVGEPAKTTVVVDIGDLTPWTREPELMALGYWDFHWCDLSLQVDRVDPKASTLTLNMTFEKPDHPPYFLKGERPFYLFNALCALNRPGEWFLDRRSGRLYLWPEDGVCPRDGECVLSETTAPLVAFRDVRDVRIEGLVIEGGRGTAIVGDRCERVAFDGNVLRNFGGSAATITGCRDVTFADNLVHTFGHGGIRLTGGDRRTLTPANVRIVNNEIWDLERWRHTYMPCVDFTGVGLEVAYNRFHDMPSSVMRLSGNDLLVLSNVVENVVQESDDQGAVDLYNDPSYAGVYFGWNLWRDVGCTNALGPYGQAAIRFDDKVSNMTVFGNRFVRCGKKSFGAVQINGGRNVVVDNNLFEECRNGVSISFRSDETWAAYMKQPDIIRKIHGDLEITSAPFRKYPGIAGIETMRQVNVLSRNVLTDEGQINFFRPDPTVVTLNLEYGGKQVVGKDVRDVGFLPLPRESELGPRPSAARRHAGELDRRR